VSASAAMCSNALDIQVDANGIAIARIDLPGRPMNFATLELGIELGALIDRVIADTAVRGVVLTSSKADFMAGGDIHAIVAQFEHLGDDAAVYREIARPFTTVLRRLETCGKPFAAAINGSALGGGLELALACHYRVLAELPKLVLALPEVSIGLIPGAGGTQRLPRLIGIEAATSLMLEGTRLSPTEALKRGIVHALVAPGEVVDAARQWILNGGSAQQPWDRKGYRVPTGAGFFDAGINRYSNATATRLSVETRHNYPAPIALLSAVVRGCSVPIDAGLRIESREFTRLQKSPVSRNLLRTTFISRNACDRLARRPADVATRTFRRIGVIGAGLMGAGVAQVAAERGIDVVLLETSESQAQAGRQRIAEGYHKRVAKGRLDAALVDGALARVTPTADYAALKDCELVVEAVFEDRKVKAAVFEKLGAVLSSDAIIASNTSALPISGLAESVAQQQRFIGLHFFSPVERMPLVEVISGRHTSVMVLAQALDFVKQLRKTPIQVNDHPGFFTTRIITAYLFESVGMLGDGCSPVLIDNLAQQAGFGIGPLALLDELTLDLTHRAVSQRRDEAGSNWREPYGFQVLDTFVRQLGRKGRRHGAGFYEYVEGRRTPWPGLRAVYPPRTDISAVEAAEIRERMLLIQALEAARAWEEGVVDDAAQGDVGSVLGIGFPAYTGGVYSLIDTMGPTVFITSCDRLAARHGERFRPSRWMRERASRGELFHTPTAQSALL
jgi:3-hydroxyacyl-CoA dehydrogenase / enoyl-CoA hydratase / 3-hydroxybutyryl-CoA epimerase